MPRRWLAGVFAISALWAVLVAVFSTDSVHRLWGVMAACGYGLAVLAVVAWKERGADAALGLSFFGALVIPLAWMAAKALEQPEVAVVARSAQTLIHQGTPYADPTTLAATQDPNAYNPYLPVMTLFGLPRAIFGSGLLTDPRVWFGVVFLIVFWYALRQGGARDPVRWAALVAASPVIAFELAVGGTDVPMVAFLCLGFAFLWPRVSTESSGNLVQGGVAVQEDLGGRNGSSPNGNWGDGKSQQAGRLGESSPPTIESSQTGGLSPREIVLAGLALGIGAAIKATAWPAVLVAIALLAVRDGRRQAAVFALTALAVVAAFVGPFVVVHPKALVENTIKFPLGLAHVTSQASSPLPGHDLAQTGPLGHLIVVVLLAAAGVAVAVSLVVRPPRSVPRAVLLLAGAMTLMFVLAPSTRFGYFIYPATLAIWLLAAAAGRTRQPEPVTQDPGTPPASSRTSPQTSSVTRPAG
jgi:Glycosyltransferase family 87